MIDYINLARQAGIDVLEVESERASMWPATPEGLAKFAELVLEEAGKTCDAIEDDRWALYKGRKPYTGRELGRADNITQGESSGATLCAEAIRAMKPNAVVTGAPR
jgi:hypothetical protein